MEINSRAFISFLINEMREWYTTGYGKTNKKIVQLPSVHEKRGNIKALLFLNHSPNLHEKILIFYPVCRAHTQFVCGDKHLPPCPNTCRPDCIYPEHSGFPSKLGAGNLMKSYRSSLGLGTGLNPNKKQQNPVSICHHAYKWTKI